MVFQFSSSACDALISATRFLVSKLECELLLVFLPVNDSKASQKAFKLFLRGNKEHTSGVLKLPKIDIVDRRGFTCTF
jgi:hypothetical protein